MGTKVNLPLAPFTGDTGWLAAFRAVVPPLVEAFRPEVLVTQLGCDSHRTDPLANLSLTTAAYRETARALHDLAHRFAGGRWVATGGGGYQWATVVPRAWALYFAEMAGADVADALPRSWVERVRSETGQAPPPTFSEPATGGADAESATGGDRDAMLSVEAVKERVFPLHGLT